MRSRSAASSKTVESAIAEKPPANVAPGRHVQATEASFVNHAAPAIEILECECGLKTTFGSGACKRCNRSLVGRPVVEVVPTQRAAAKSPVDALADDLSGIVGRLKSQHDLSSTLPEVAAWTPTMRRDVATWLLRGGALGRPAFLTVPAEEDPVPAEILGEGARLFAAEAREAARAEQGDLAKNAESLAKRAAAARSATTARAAAQGAGEPTGERVSVHWGEEKYSPIPGSYSTCSVGPFWIEVAVEPGQSRYEALREAYAILEQMADAERERKLTKFVAQLRDVRVKVSA